MKCKYDCEEVCKDCKSSLTKEFMAQMEAIKDMEEELGDWDIALMDGLED